MASSVIISERLPQGIATLMARKGVKAAALEAALGVAPPQGPMRVVHDGLALIGTGPGTWLAMSDAPGSAWPSSLTRRLKGLASVSDQSGSYAVFRVTGANARTLLQRGAHIDMHPDVFGPQSVATTVIAHIGVIFWQAGEDAFDIATFRSYAPSFRRWLETTAASV